MSRSLQLASVLSAFLRRGRDTILEGSAPPEPSQSVPSEVSTSGEIPVVYRLAIIYLMLPLLIWLVGWFEWWFGVPVAVLLALGFWPVLRPARTSFSWPMFYQTLRQAVRPTTIALLLIAVAWVMVTAAGGVFDSSNWDWGFNRAIFLELAQNDWPVEPFTSFRAFLPEPAFMRHYLGYYMVPGQIGNWLGPAALNWAVPLWTFFGAGLLLFMFTRGYAGGKTIAAAIILILFSGMDIARIAFAEGLDWFDLSLNLDGWPQLEVGKGHLEWESRLGLELQYSSHMTGMMWAPKHFLAGGLLTMLLTHLQRHGRFMRVSGILLAGVMFWSPFVFLGTLPIAAVLVFRNGIRPFLSWQNILLSPPLALLMVAYLTSGSGVIERGWIWTRIDNPYDVLAVLPLFYLTEFLVLALLLVLVRPRLAKNPFFIVSLAVLVLIALYSFGQNEMRIATPSLILLCSYCAGIVTGRTLDWERRRSNWRVALVGATVVVLGLGAVTPAVELLRANNNHNLKMVRYEELGPLHSLEQVLLTSPPKYSPPFVTFDLPRWMQGIWRRGDAVPSASNEGLLIQSHYNVYLDLGSKALVYLRDSCSEDDSTSRFFLHVTPLDRDVLPLGQTQDTFYFDIGGRLGGTCLSVRQLDISYAIGTIRTGQLNEERTHHSWVAHYFSGPYRNQLLKEAGEPIIRSRFLVYLLERELESSARPLSPSRLLYFKDSCGPEDLRSRFFLKLTPVNVEDLPEGQQQAGYGTLDFVFEEIGGRNRGICFAVRDLPGYEIKEIRTGQLQQGGGVLWESRFEVTE